MCVEGGDLLKLLLHPHTRAHCTLDLCSGVFAAPQLLQGLAGVSHRSTTRD